MLQTVQCPHCRRKLAVDVQHVGTAVVCPMCKEAFTPPAVEGALPVAAPQDPITLSVREEPPRPRLASAGSPGRDFADSAGIELDEQHDEAVSSASVAERRLERWKEEMPEVASAYQPSGKMPGGAALTMLIGSVVGAVGGALAFLAAGGITAALTFGLTMFIGWMSETCGRVLCVVVILAFAVGIVGGALSYGVLGWAAAAITTSAGMIGKNRNAAAAALFSVGSALMALVLGHLAADQAEQWLFPGWFTATWAVWLKYVGVGLGSLLAIACAAIFSRQMVKDSKFCEGCEAYMEEEARRGLGLGATKALTLAVREGQFEAAADLLHCPEGKEGVPKLFWCATCGRGYLDLHAKFKCTWVKGDENEEKEEEWLAASAELRPEEVDLFRQGRRRGRSSDT